MKFSKNWMSKGMILFLLLIVACGNPEASPLPTQAPIASIKDEETAETDSTNNVVEPELNESTGSRWGSRGG